MFKEQIGKSMEVYVDDMLVKSRQSNDHVRDLAEMFNILRQYGMKINPLKCSFGVASGKFLGFIVNARGIEANPKKIQAIRDVRPPRTIKQVQSLNGKVAALSRFISRSTENCIPFFDVIKKGKRNFDWTTACEEAFRALVDHLERPPILSKPLDHEELYIYLAVSQHAISAALIREENRVQRRFTMSANDSPERKEIILRLRSWHTVWWSHRVNSVHTFKRIPSMCIPISPCVKCCKS